MKLQRIKLTNFRQFYGTQTLEIAGHTDKNVTLVHAENGVGKTTLLNSILWCFYGEVTKKFEKAEQIINFQAVTEGVNNAAVEVFFEHEGVDYLTQRSFTARSARKPEQVFNAHQIQRGVYKPIEAAETFINSVIPQEMARYYFFDGEHAETFSSETNYKAVGQAIRNMLGCNLVETAIDDLENATKTFNQLIGEVPGDEEIQEVTKILLDIDSRHTRAKEQLQAKMQDREATQDQITSILQKLRESEGAKDLQELRDAKVNRLNSVEDQLKAAEQAIIKWVGTKTLPLIASRLAKDTFAFINQESLKGRIPSPYNEQFVSSLLSSELCVCERPLQPGTPEWKAVNKLLKEAATAELMGRIVRARSRIMMLREMRSDAPALLEHEQGKVAKLLDERRELELQLGELSNRIKEIPIEEIAEREKAHQVLTAKLKQLDQDIGGLNFSLMQLDRSRKEAQGQLDKLAGNTAKSRRLMIRRDLSERGAELLATLLQQHEIDARHKIAALVNKILEKTARRDYRFDFRDNFVMELSFSDGRPVPRSSGENQLMTLAFIAALIEFSVERSKDKGESLLIPGIIAPLVLDSPFGQLDSKYRVDTAEFVPNMASQVVLLVSSSQGDQSVLSALKPYIGKEYVLISENTGPRGPKPDDAIVLGGKRISTSLYNCKKNLARIEEV